MGRGGQNIPRFTKTATGIRLKPAAVENWARLTNIADDIDFLAARQMLLKEIDVASISKDPPDWMSSAPPDVKAWIHLGKISLALVDSDNPAFRFYATNSLAPKSVRRNAEKLGVPLPKSVWTDEQTEKLEACSRDELAKTISISQHAVERVQERFRNDIEKEDIEFALAATGEFVSDPPAWARAARKDVPILLLDIASEKIAFPLGTNDGEIVATTAIPESWSQKDLFGSSGQELLDRIYVSDSLDRERIEKIILSGRIESDSEGIWVVSGDQRVSIRPLSAGQDLNRTENKTWFVEK